jgi:hypothetical protein
VSADTITLLETRAPLVAAKRIRLRRGEEADIADYDSCKHFTVHERAVGSLGDIAELLSKVEKFPRYMMIRGRAREG